MAKTDVNCRLTDKHSKLIQNAEVRIHLLAEKLL